MSVNETLSKKVYRTLKEIDGSGNKTWNKLAFWTTADQVELENGDNAQDVLESIMTRNIDVYVSQTGSDTTGTGSSSYPYKTINMALRDIPKNMSGFWANIHIIGGTYAENVVIQGFGGARVYVVLNGDVTINGSIFVLDCDSSVLFQSTTGNSYVLTINNSTDTNGAIAISSSKFVYFGNQVIINSTTRGISVYGGSGCSMANNVTINNAAEYAVIASQSARVGFANLLTGSNNGIGIRTSDGSVVSYDPNQFTLTATTIKQPSDGGIITNDLVTQSQIGAKVIVSATAPSDTSAVWVY